MNAEQYIGKITARSLVVFFLLAYGITWGLSILATKGLLPFTIPAALMGISAILLHYGPSMAAFFVVSVTGGRDALRSLWRKITHWRVGYGWYLFIFLFPVSARLAAVTIDILMGGQWPKFMSAGDVPAGNPIMILPVVFLAVFFQAGVAEEIGWRGYGLPGLQRRYSALMSSIILGVLWCFWHFHPQNFPNMWPVAFWYLYNIVAFTILLTWVYNNTEGSILLAILFHTASNVSDWIVPTFSPIAGNTSIRPFIIQGTLVWIFAVGVVVHFGAKHLSRNSASQT